MIPHAKFFHDYMGFTGSLGLPIFQTSANPMYSANFCKLFTDHTMSFKHKVELFFPEIEQGVFLVSDIKYDVLQDPTDDVTVTHSVDLGGQYEEYVVIENFTATFEIELFVDFGKRLSIQAPLEINCAYIDIILFNQRISLTTHANNIFILPYLMSYKTDFPPEAARQDNSFSNISTNSDLSYGFILSDSCREALQRKKISFQKLDMELFEIKRKATELEVQAEKDNPMEDIYSPETQPKTKDKFTISLPQSLFRDKMELYGFPLFNSEINLECCKYWEGALYSVYFGLYDVPVLSEGSDPVSCLKTPKECQETPQYEVRNKVIDGFITYSDLSWDELDSRIPGMIDQPTKLEAEKDMEI